MKTALTLIAALLSTAAQAQTVGLHLFSEHPTNTFERRWANRPAEMVRYNEKNYGVYVISRDGWLAGTYENSYYRRTFYAGYMWDGPTFGPIGTHIAGAFATGYDWCPGVGKLRPMVMPSLTVKLPASFAVRYAVSPASGGVFQHLSIERKF